MQNDKTSAIKHLRQPTAILLLTLLLQGCSQVKNHVWQQQGTDSYIVKNTSGWPILSQKDYFHVAQRYREIAAKMLENQSSILLSNEQASTWSLLFKVPPDESLKPYLIRGVAYYVPFCTYFKV